MDLDLHDTAESPAVHDACGLGSKKRQLVSVEDYPKKFVSPQLLDSKGQEVMYLSKTTGISGGRES